jgi:hypothetical protein
MTFVIGEIINPKEMDLQLQIISVEPLVGVIVTNKHPTTYTGSFFPVGRELRFQRVRDTDSWTIITDQKDMPWFVLGIYEGRKRFDHYR